MFVWFSFMKCDFLLIEYSLVVLNPLNLPFYPIDRGLRSHHIYWTIGQLLLGFQKFVITSRVAALGIWASRNSQNATHIRFSLIFHSLLEMVPKKSKSKRKTIRQQYTARKLVVLG